MTNPTRTRAEIQAETELQEIDAQIESLSAKRRKLSEHWIKAIEVPSEYTWGRKIEICTAGGTALNMHVNHDALIPAADLIPRAEHEAKVIEAVTEALEGKPAAVEAAYALGATNARVGFNNARDAVAYLVKEYHMDTAHQDTADARPHTHDHDGQQYTVTVKRASVEQDDVAVFALALAAPCLEPKAPKEADRGN